MCVVRSSGMASSQTRALTCCMLDLGSPARNTIRKVHCTTPNCPRIIIYQNLRPPTRTSSIPELSFQSPLTRVGSPFSSRQTRLGIYELPTTPCCCQRRHSGRSFVSHEGKLSETYSLAMKAYQSRPRGKGPNGEVGSWVEVLRSLHINASSPSGLTGRTR